MTFWKVAIVAFCIHLGLVATVARGQAVFERAAPFVGESFDGVPCKGKGRGVGPLDYTDARDRADGLFKHVEGGHFTIRVETLQGGKDDKKDNAYPDLNYTLLSIPNHHRALYSMVRLQSDPEKRRRILIQNGTSAECFLQRAENFSPTDSIPPLLFGIFYHKLSKYDEAMKKYQLSLSLDSNDPQLHYNMGLLLVDMGRADEALKHAKIAYQMNYPLMGLKTRLIEQSVWIESSEEKL